MLDAEIAAILLNRRGLGGDGAEDLLREGNLHFVAEPGGLGPTMKVDCLLFADGSRAFRVGHANAGPGAGPGWSKWAVVEPFASPVPLRDANKDPARDEADSRCA